MNKKVKTIVLAIFAAASSLVSNAQKTAHINLDSLITIMPESKEARKAQEDFLKQLEAEAAQLQAEIQTKYQEYQENMNKWNELVKKNKERELQDMDQRLKEFQQSAQMEIQKKNEALAKPVIDKAKKAIEQVAKENGYKYVLDTSAGFILYSEPADDIFNMVKKKLGIVTPVAAPAPAPGTAPAPKK